jgi:plastocyanin
MSSARAQIAVLTLIAASLLASGCGDDPKPVVDRDATLHLRLDEYRIIPRSLRVRAGRVHIVAKDVGRLTHNVAVETFSNSPETDTPVERGRTATAHPGETVSELERIVLTPGKYRLVCTIANHDDLGQYATLVVTKR